MTQKSVHLFSLLIKNIIQLHFALLSFLQSVFLPISCFCFNLPNTLCKIELFSEYRSLLRILCHGAVFTAQRVLIVKTFY